MTVDRSPSYWESYVSSTEFRSLRIWIVLRYKCTCLIVTGIFRIISFSKDVRLHIFDIRSRFSKGSESSTGAGAGAESGTEEDEEMGAESDGDSDGDEDLPLEMDEAPRTAKVN